MKYNAYLYPITNRLKTGIYNPYLDNFMQSTQSYVNYLNQHYPSDTGIFNLLKYIHKTDVLFLNWIENLPEKKGGLIQTLFFLLVLRMKKVLGVKVVWTLHNKVSHSKGKLFLKKWLFASLIKRSDLIITHAREGIRFAEQWHQGASSRVFYFPHPVVPEQEPEFTIDQEYDVIIWGTLAPYKGIDAFLEFLQQNTTLAGYRILIAGKATSSDFYQKIKRLAGDTVKIKNQFIDKQELARLIQSSNAVLFTYAGGSVLSSGALIDSLAYRARVIGPNVGAFADLGEEEIIDTYKDFSEIPDILDNLKNNKASNPEKMDAFLRNHTWQKFARSFKKALSNV